MASSQTIDPPPSPSHEAATLSIRNARLPAIKDKKRIVIKDHLFELHFFVQPTWCSHCTQFIYGLGKQGYRCLRCHYAVHRYCAELILSNCLCDKSRQLGLNNDGVKHTFEKEIELSTNNCDHCGQVIGGFFRKGYKCVNPICQMYVHSHCIEFVPDNCGFLRHKKFGSILLSLLYKEELDNTVNLKFTVHGAKNLLPADSNGLSDPYCKIRLCDANGEALYKTSTEIQYKTLNPQFGESFEWTFPYSPDSKLLIQVYDYDNIISSDFLGGMSLLLGELKAYGTGDMMWFNLLGTNVWRTTHELEEIVSEKKNEIVKHAQALRLHSQKDFFYRQQSKEVLSTIEEEPTIVSLDSFNLLELLGTGGFGKVYLAEPKFSQGEMCAIKIIHKSYLVESDSIESVEVEKNILIKYGKFEFITDLVATFQDEYNVYMVIEYFGGGDLFNLLIEKQSLPPNIVAYFIAEVSLGLFYLHREGVIHRDLKLENIMLTLDGHVKLIDFGLSRVGIVSGKNFADTFCGTPTYMAPEIMNRELYDSAVDLWSLGIITFELLTGLMPYNGFDVQTLKPLVKRLPAFPPSLKLQSVVFISNLLRYTPKERLGYLPANGEMCFRNSTFFIDIEWDELEARRLPPPILPSQSSKEQPEKNISFQISKGEPRDQLAIDQNLFKDFDYLEDAFKSKRRPSLFEFSPLSN